MKSLDSASSNRSGHLASQPGGPDGEAVSSDWLTLANRIETIARLRAERDAHADGTRLVFDAHDQATIASN